MDWTLEFIQPQNYIRITRVGVFDIELQTAVYEDLISRDFFKPDMPIFFDNRNLDFSHTNYDLIRKMSENYRKFAARLGSCKMALLMKSTADFGRGRQFATLSEPYDGCEILVFLDESEALEWLLE